MAGLVLSQGRFEQAEELIHQVPPHPASAAIFNAIGVIQARRGHGQMAITNLTRVVELLSTDHEAYHSLAPLLAQSGRIET